MATSQYPLEDAIAIPMTDSLPLTVKASADGVRLSDGVGEVVLLVGDGTVVVVDGVVVVVDGVVVVVDGVVVVVDGVVVVVVDARALGAAATATPEKAA